ncbi:PEP-CTERM sorting domain-containing protein [Colwellia sp. D2M02]|uniref:Ice-binding protein C-terminal domain-containing protein n=1 Tax=Colwellia asteriadis TaxID=517723 RepID=A0ABN1L430_9GAMM|nr:PEP-CTERM sorting domain-containing protein [Colwellia sp. D2M02]MBU2894619.1 PEP-CTERM sorting domain-containing protein [Colwellia sp. D2M02]
MKLFTSLALVLALILSTTTHVNATTIKLNNNIALGALNLDQGFTDFYGYGSNIRYSSNTGYEANNALVMFFAEYNNNLALFVLADSANSTGKGKAKFSVNNLNDFGNIIFKDDTSDTNITNGIKWAWASKRNDGLVFQLNDPNNFNLDIAITNTQGLGQGFKFLSFDASNQVTSHNFTQANSLGEFNIATIPEPTTIAVLALALFALAASRRKA